jgi:hypothetical protein
MNLFSHKQILVMSRREHNARVQQRSKTAPVATVGYMPFSRSNQFLNLKLASMLLGMP